jgi:3-oxoacyl-[acyl-carrier protein] reductase
MVLNGKSGIVIGAANGIGRKVADVFYMQGSKLLLSDIDGEALSSLTAELSQESGCVSALRADVTSREDMQAVAAAAFASFGQIDFLCYVAGIYPATELAGMTEAFWNKTLDVNLKGVFLAVQACIPEMRKRGRGRIAVVSSVTGPRVALEGLSAYAAAKAGVCGFVRAAALELAPMGITVNAVLPGTIATKSLFRQLGNGVDLATVASATPLQRVGEAVDIANALLFLVSDASSFITGQEIIVDGGSVIRE